MRAAAVFDLDGTLVRGTSAERLLVPYLAGWGLIGARQAAAFLSRLMTLPLVGPTRALRRNKRYLAGLEVEALREGFSRFSTDVLEARFCPAVVARMEALRAAGHALYLLTGAPDFIAQAVALRLGMAGALGTPLEVRTGRYTGFLAGPHYYGAAKVQGVLELARRHRLDLGRSFGFANHVSDAAFLGCFGHPVATAPDAGLRRRARRRGWEVLTGA